MEIANALFTSQQVNIHRQLIKSGTRGHELVFSPAQTREAELPLRIRFSSFQFGHRVEKGDASSRHDLPGGIENRAGNCGILLIVRGTGRLRWTAGGGSRSLCVGGAGQKQK